MGKCRECFLLKALFEHLFSFSFSNQRKAHFGSTISPQCFGPSMLPTLNMTGDIVGYEHLTQRFSKLDTGDLVVAVSPTDPSKLVCKRIIGVEGDRVCIDPISMHRRYITVS